MKLIMAVIHHEDEHNVMVELQKKGFNATKLCSTGGFLRAKNTTLLIGTEDEKVDDAIKILDSKSKTRTTISAVPFFADTVSVTPIEVEIGGATVFVMNVERFEKL